MKLSLTDGRAVEVRDLAENEDVFALCDFVNSLVREDTFLAHTEEYTPEQETAWLQKRVEKMRNGECVHVLAFHGNEIVAGCSAECKEGKSRHVSEMGIAIMKGWRNARLGKKLMEHVLERAKKNPKMEIVYLKVFGNNQRARHLYESLGFKEVARLPGFVKHRGERTDDVYMVLK
jgi:ribosomal protein S18 acetylase RimI-like enzyme